MTPIIPNADEEGYYHPGFSDGEVVTQFIDPDLKPEHTDEIILGYNRTFTSSLSAGVNVICRFTRNIIEDVGSYMDENSDIHLATDVDMDDPAAIEEWYDRLDEQGFNWYYYTNPGDAYRDYYGLELTTSYRTEKVVLHASYTWSQVKGTLSDVQPGHEFNGSVEHFSVYYDTPYLSDDLDGPLYYDAPHFLKLDAVWELPLGFYVGTSARWRSGYVYEKYGIDENGDPDYGDGCRLIEGRGAYRYPTVFLADLSLQKDVPLWKWGTLTAIIDIRNLFNNQVVIRRNEDEGPEFGQDLEWIAPTAFTFHLKCEF